jgi:UDP-GlcNAc:undecaprenyl-phosphate GlcNAc-1-phosphate transferase
MTPRSNLYLAWFLGSAVLAAALTPVARGMAHRFGLVDRPGGQNYKWHHRPTAYLGGAVIAFAVLVMVVVDMFGRTPLDRITVILLGGLLCGAVGLWDDWKSLGAGPKLCATTAAGLAVWAAGIRVAFTGNGAADLALTLIWLVVVTHAVNVIDNMDGVAVGLAGLAAVAAFGIAVNTGQTRVALMAAAVGGACIGFIPFNFKPATIFLGDAGTLFLGFVLASLALTLDIPGGPHLARVTVPVLLLALPIFNTALVIVSRRRRGRRITVGGTDGLAHRLVALGLTRGQAAVVFWIAGTLLAANAVLVARLGETAAVATDVALLTIGAIAIWMFERVEAPSAPAQSARTAVSQTLVAASTNAATWETREAENVL